MKAMILKFALMSLISSWGFGARGQIIRQANKQFKEGKFKEARSSYAALLEKAPDNLEARIYMGYLALLSNKLDEAEQWLLKARAMNGRKKEIDHFLAEVYYRRKDFAKAVPYFDAIGRKAMANKLRSFEGQIPYQIANDFEQVSVKFMIAEPLPFVKVVIDGKEGSFILDTGGGELILDTEFAREANTETFGDEAKGEFGGGKLAVTTNGRVSTVVLGDLTVKNAPVFVLPLRHIELAGTKIDGIIGTVFLYQFLSTIDYRRGQLILRNKSKYHLDSLVLNSDTSHIVPFVMADDHYMLSRATVNNSRPLLLFIDTGLAGQAFSATPSIVKDLRLPVQRNNKQKAMGGGGAYNSYPIDIDRICLGDMCVEKLHGELGSFPPQFEKGFGFRIDGLLSHEFFSNFSFTIDFESMQYMLSR